MILITGCPRSGTSLTTGILRACGLSLGNTKVNALNEATDVREKVVKPYLRSIGADPMGQHPLPGLCDVRIDDDWRWRVWKALGFPNEPWGYKCAKATLIWPLFAHAFPEAKWVIVRRDRERIIDSCVRTQFMRRHNSRDGWGRWVDVHLERFAEMRGELDCIEVWPDMEPDTFQPVVKFCGLSWSRAAASEVINPGKWHAA